MCSILRFPTLKYSAEIQEEIATYFRPWAALFTAAVIFGRRVVNRHLNYYNRSPREFLYFLLISRQYPLSKDEGRTGRGGGGTPQSSFSPGPTQVFGPAAFLGESEADLSFLFLFNISGFRDENFVCRLASCSSSRRINSTERIT